MNDAGKAVFLSYASQDAEAAKRICDALRAGGVEVWFDQNELVGGDAWDQKIRKQIKDCALLIPIVSANTQARTEGYFRLEWRLADQRTHLMGRGRTFLLPVCIDDTKDAEADVPDSFLAVQWTRLKGGETSPAFAARVKKLLEGGIPEDRGQTAEVRTENRRPKIVNSHRPRWLAPVIGGVVVAAIVLTIAQPWRKPGLPPSAPAAARSSEARELVAKAWVLLNKPEMARAELDAADALCKRAAALDPTDAEVWAAWSHVNGWYCFHNLDNTAPRQEAAREYAVRAMQLDAKSFEARLAQAFYWVRGSYSPTRLKDAQNLLHDLLRERPDEPRALFTLGFALFMGKAYPEGVAVLERLAHNPGFAAVAWDEIGWHHYFYGDATEAEAAIDRSLAAKPYWNNLGLKITLAERIHGDMDLAEAALKQMPATALQEDWGIGFACEVYQWRREPLRTIKVLEGVSRDWIRYYFYNHPRAFLLGEARLMAKQESAARRDFQRSLDLIEKQLTDDPNNVELLGLKARALQYLGEPEEALKIYRLVKELGGQENLQVFFEPPAVAVAAIKSMAESKDLVLSRSFYSAASLRLDPHFDRLRAEPEFQALLGQGEARQKPAASLSPADASLPTVDSKSVAVLAFANLSDDKANEYFSDGISEELLNVLAKVPGLKVSARTSAFYFKGRDVPVPEIAQKLGVAYVIEGSVRKQGGKVRITAQLIKAADGFHVWSDTFTRDLKDIFAVQDEIAGLIAQSLSLTLREHQASAPVDPQAFECYLQAREAWNERTPAGFARAAELLDRVQSLAPAFARGYAARSDLWAIQDEDARLLGRFGQRNEPRLSRIFSAANRALELDPECAEAHASLGNAYSFSWQPGPAIREFQRAIELNPNYATAHQWLGRMLQAEGRIDEAAAELQRAAELDPLSHRILDNNAEIQQALGNYAAALTFSERALALRPDSIQAATYRSRALSALGRHDEAMGQVRRSGVDHDEFFAWLAVDVFARAGLVKEAEALVARLPVDRGKGLALASMGHPEQALAVMEPDDLSQAVLAYILVSDCYDSVRTAPRFQEILAKVGSSDAQARAEAWRAANRSANSSRK